MSAADPTPEQLKLLPDPNTYKHLRCTLYDRATQIETIWERVEWAEVRDGCVVRTWFVWRRFGGTT